jgi:hypothetical protein
MLSRAGTAAIPRLEKPDFHNRTASEALPAEYEKEYKPPLLGIKIYSPIN